MEMDSFSGNQVEPLLTLDYKIWLIADQISTDEPDFAEILAQLKSFRRRRRSNLELGFINEFLRLDIPTLAYLRRLRDQSSRTHLSRTLSAKNLLCHSLLQKIAMMRNLVDEFVAFEDLGKVSYGDIANLEALLEGLERDRKEKQKRQQALIISGRCNKTHLHERRNGGPTACDRRFSHDIPPDLPSTLFESDFSSSTVAILRSALLRFLKALSHHPNM